MKARALTWLLGGALTLAVVAPASAQSFWSGRQPGLIDYTGAITPWGYVPPTIGLHRVVPSYGYLYYNMAPAVVRPVYVPFMVPQRVFAPATAFPLRPIPGN